MVARYTSPHYVHDEMLVLVVVVVVVVVVVAVVEVVAVSFMPICPLACLFACAPTPSSPGYFVSFDRFSHQFLPKRGRLLFCT